MWPRSCATPQHPRARLDGLRTDASAAEAPRAASCGDGSFCHARTDCEWRFLRCPGRTQSWKRLFPARVSSRLLASILLRPWDPVADGRVHLHGIEIAASALEALDGADAAVLVTEWPELRELDWAEAGARMRNRLVVDGRNILDADELRAVGFTYEGIGRAVQ